MPSNHHILCLPLFLLPSISPSVRVFSSELALHIRWPKYWRFIFSTGPSNEYNDEKKQNVYSSYNMPDSVLSTIHV